jgi:xanthine dehydrogenase accessory factor
MQELLPDIDRWRAEGQPVALATVIETWGSAPRGVGSKLALTAAGQMAGSVSGGCVEGAVIETGVDMLKKGGSKLLHFGVADETAWEVGLACGGTIEVFVSPLDTAVYDRLHTALAAEQAAALVTVIRGPADLLGHGFLLEDGGDGFGALGAGLDGKAIEAARSALSEGHSRRVVLGPETDGDPVEIFVDVMLPSPTLIMVGGVHIAIALTTIARTLGYRTIVIDPRTAFAGGTRFAHADQLIKLWPDKGLAQVAIGRSTAITALTHDPKLDDPALIAALASPAFYVGALGSRKTHEKRRHRLLEQGVPQEQLDRLFAPVGLDIGAKTPEEIALSVMAQIVGVRSGEIVKETAPEREKVAG